MARKTKKDLFESRRVARQMELDAAFAAIDAAVGWVGATPERAMGTELLKAFRSALESTAGLRGRVVNAERTRLEIYLAPTSIGYTWPGTIEVEATDVIASELGAEVGYQVVARPTDRADVVALEWRDPSAMLFAMRSWNLKYEGYLEVYRRVGSAMNVAKPSDFLDAVRDVDRAILAATAMREMQGVKDTLEACDLAADPNADLAVQEALRGLIKRCTGALIHGNFRPTSTSDAVNLAGRWEALALGEVAEYAQGILEVILV